MPTVEQLIDVLKFVNDTLLCEEGVTVLYYCENWKHTAPEQFKILKQLMEEGKI